MNEELKRWLMFRPWQRHSLVLMVGGLVYIGVGVAFLSVGDLSQRRELSLDIALRFMPLDSWAMVFVFAGFLACLSSRWPSFVETWGYMVLTGLSAAWSAIYFLSIFLGDAPYTNLSYGLVWGLLAFLWWGISGLVNPDKVVVVVENGPH